ncbi:MAG: thiol-disulfide isomerase [Terriglobia bacterium]|nr:MAG: thiol-disulfide isomerase [Terriglobia bacterium]
MRVWVTGFLFVGIAAAAESSSSAVTYHKDILPILQKNCQSCHRPGQVAPMSFLSYEGTRPWAKAMKVAVATKKMPPWFADPQFGHFANDRSLKQSDIDTIAKWADSGAPEGNAKDAPPSVKWPANGWTIEPDLIVNGPETAVPAHPKNNVIEWSYVIVPSGITQDTWITSMEIRPSEPSITHHICVFFKPHTDDVKYNEPVWADRERDDNGSAVPSAAGVNGRGIPKSITEGSNGIEGCYVPGQLTQDYRVHGAAKLVKAGSDIVFQIHYTPNGKDLVDRPRLGFTIAKAPPQRVYVSLGMSAPSDAKNFAIPPNTGNWESPTAEATFTQDVELVWMFPHMHVRGKEMTYRLVYPDGKTETVLSVPRYDFNWQLGYDLAKPVKVPKGTRLVVTAHYDNSVNNKFNPDPNRTVYYGDMTWEEMMYPFFSVVVDAGVDARKIIKIDRGKQSDGA